MHQSSLKAFFGATNSRPPTTTANENDQPKTATKKKSTAERQKPKAAVPLNRLGTNRQRSQSSSSTEQQLPPPPRDPVRERHETILASLNGTSSNSVAMLQENVSSSNNQPTTSGQATTDINSQQANVNNDDDATLVETTESDETRKRSGNDTKPRRKRGRVRSSNSKMSNQPVPVMDWIHQRSMLGRSNVQPIHPPIPWSLAHWLFLSDMGSTLVCSNIRRLSWDKDGVLLAIMAGPKLIVYDWDSVVAADRQGRNRQGLQQAKKKNQSSNRTCFGVQPTLSVTLPSPFKASSSLGCLSLQWNPFNPDEIAMLHLDGHVCIFDLNLVLEWMETRHQNDPSAQSWSAANTAPCKSIRLDQSMAGKSVGNLLFVGRAHLIVSMGNEIACYSLAATNKNKSSVRLVWKWTWQCVTSILLVLPDQILIGSQKGNLVLVNWKKVHQPAFSSRAIPTVLAKWSTLAMLTRNSFPDHFGGMGILHLEGDGSNDIGDRAVSPPRLLRLSWHTPSGWILKGQLDLLDRTLHSVEIIHATKPASVCDHAGAPVEFFDWGRTRWSLPASGSVMSTGTTNAIVVAKVPRVVHVLSHHDHRVLDTGQRIERIEEPPKLIHFNRHTGTKQECALATKSKRWSVTALAVHPSHEWLVVCTNDTANHGIRIYNARRKA